jgi:hypothetical protein
LNILLSLGVGVAVLVVTAAVAVRAVIELLRHFLLRQVPITQSQSVLAALVGQA